MPPLRPRHRFELSEESGGLNNSPCHSRVGVGDQSLRVQRVGVPLVGVIEEDASLTERRDDLSPRCSAFVRVEDRLHILRELHSPLGSGALVGYLLVTVIRNSFVKPFDADLVLRLVTNETLDPAEHAQVQRLRKVR